jgi:hypothetical protein
MGAAAAICHHMIVTGPIKCVLAAPTQCSSSQCTAATVAGHMLIDSGFAVCCRRRVACRVSHVLVL